MKLIDADDLYQKCIEIQLKKRNRYFDIDDVIKLIKKAPTVDVLDRIRAEIEEPLKINEDMHTDSAKAQAIALSWCIEIIDKYRGDRK